MKKVVSKLKTTQQPKTDVLDDIHKKIHNSAALNGGFDALIHKIDKIEHGQGQLVSKVDKIHDAIYDPNDGIFSRLNDYKIENSEKFAEISQHMSEINEWKKHREREDVKNDESFDESNEKVIHLEKSVDSLVKSKTATWAFVKWILIAIGGATVTLLFNWIETKLHP
ncbi:MAG: hypothetical protein EBR82_00520 [Caulobacteraceae bacterium]|nr:hypothetical protein [Caulobacteraceae bacterium]